ncbi:MAG: hypothetical protein K6F54_00970 [Lachnospiraceae bacterium]|nr:hypothetical protein [Lachnospiraceae bacterium]
MKEKVSGAISRAKEWFKNRFSGLYGPDDLACMEEGMGTVEVILIIVVLIGLVLIFKKQIRAIVETIMNKISSDSDSVMS